MKNCEINEMKTSFNQSFVRLLLQKAERDQVSLRRSDVTHSDDVRRTQPKVTTTATSATAPCGNTVHNGRQ